MGKKYLCSLLTAIMLICLSACSKGAPKIKCGVYRSETSDAYIEVFEDNTVQIMNFDLSELEKIIEDDTIDLAELNETDAQALRDRWDLNRDYSNKRVKYETDSETYKYDGTIGLTFPLDNPYGSGVSSWGISYYPAENRMMIEAESFNSDSRVIEVFVLEK